MLPLGLFKRRNFAIGNVQTFAMYGGLGITFFLLVLFLQEVAGYSALDAGFALLPSTIVMFLLSKRMGRLADRYGPRLFMGLGPLTAAAGLAWMTQLGAHVNYFTDLLPPLLLFSLGLASTVAPLTATVLSDADDRNAGIASGVNNAVARVAGLIAIAAIGAVVSSQFNSTLDQRLAGLRLSAPARTAVAQARRSTLARVDPARAGVQVAHAVQWPRSTRSTSRSGSRRCWWRSAACSDWSGSATRDASSAARTAPAVRSPASRSTPPARAWRRCRRRRRSPPLRAQSPEDERSASYGSAAAPSGASASSFTRPLNGSVRRLEQSVDGLARGRRGGRPRLAGRRPLRMPDRAHPDRLELDRRVGPSVERHAVFDHDEDGAVVDEARDHPEQPAAVGEVTAGGQITGAQTAAAQRKRHGMTSLLPSPPSCNRANY